MANFPLAITMGEPAGIGADLILKIYAERAKLAPPPFIIYGNLSILQQRAQKLGLNIKFKHSTPAQAKKYFPSYLPLINIGGEIIDRVGKINKENSQLAIKFIELATKAVLEKKCKALITAPIHKNALIKSGFNFPGHTEFLSYLCMDKNNPPPFPIMMLAHENLRTIPLTIHIELRKVALNLTKSLIVKSAKIIARDLGKYFNIKEPKLAITGLNPHAGENGVMGKEEINIIQPAVAQLRQQGINITDPLPADSLFYPPKWREFDAILATYHDQALIPIKTIAFEKAVNITLGLPIIRTSPDHGTALNLAGKNNISITSMLEAIRMAELMSNNNDR